MCKPARLYTGTPLSPSCADASVVGFLNSSFACNLFLAASAGASQLHPSRRRTRLRETKLAIRRAGWLVCPSIESRYCLSALSLCVLACGPKGYARTCSIRKQDSAARMTTLALTWHDPASLIYIVADISFTPATTVGRPAEELGTDLSTWGFFRLWCTRRWCPAA